MKDFKNWLKSYAAPIGAFSIVLILLILNSRHITAELPFDQQPDPLMPNSCVLNK